MTTGYIFLSNTFKIESCFFFSEYIVCVSLNDVQVNPMRIKPIGLISIGSNENQANTYQLDYIFYNVDDATLLDTFSYSLYSRLNLL